MTRVIGAPRSRRRRWTLLWCLTLAIGAGLLFIPGALAVHSTGFFQLDKDAQQATRAYGPTGQHDDWDNICAANLKTTANPTGCAVAPNIILPAPSTLPDKSTFVTDVFNTGTDNIFKGGTDDGDVTGWQWKEAGPSPDKADIEQAFAAQYTCTSALPSGTCDTTNYAGHKILYFGGTRFANNGDTSLGFWFFHNPVTVAGTNSTVDGTTGLTRCIPSSGCGFSGTHTAGNISLGGSDGSGCNPNIHPLTNVCTPGDIFVASAFTSKPAIQVFEWVGPGKATTCVTSNCTLQQIPIPVGSGGDNTCESTGNTIDVGCAVVNDQGSITSPWLFQDKTSKAPANVIGSSELFEGGLDLTALGFGDECISSVSLSTRSSGSSFNSVDQDFALGQIGKCESSVTTTASGNSASIDNNNANTAANGTASSGTDSATVTVNGIATWGGTVDFYLCGPDPTAKCSASGVKANGTTGNVGVPVSNTNATVSSGSATLTAAGRYCWFGVFTPNAATLAKGVTAATDDGTPIPPATVNKECFSVSAVTPTLPTQAGTSPVSFGSAVTDTATLQGAAREPGSNGGNGATPALYTSINATNGAFVGTIGFTLKGPDPNATTTNCTDNATAYTGETQTFPISVNVTGNSLGPPAIAYTASFKPGSPGKYHWLATYSYTGTAVNNNLPQNFNSTCSEHATEDVVVQQIPTTTKTVQSWVPNDTATVSPNSAGGNALQGTLNFKLFPNATCNGTTTLYNQTFGSTTTPLTANGQGNIVVNTASFDDGTGVHPNTTAIHKLDGLAGGYPTVSWLVTFTSTEASHTGSSDTDSNGVCNEQTTLTITDSP